MASLILIEGLPGSGKSSLAAHIHEYLKSQGKNSELMLETAHVNPFRFKAGTSQETVIDEFLTSIPDQWRSFADLNAPTEKLFVQEGMTFQQQVTILIWMNRANDIDPLIQKIHANLARFDCALIFLKSTRYQQSLRETVVKRGTKWIEEKLKPIASSPFALVRGLQFPDALTEMLEEMNRINDKLYGEFPFKKKTIDITNRDWPRIQHEAETFLNTRMENRG